MEANDNRSHSRWATAAMVLVIVLAQLGLARFSNLSEWAIWLIALVAGVLAAALTYATLSRRQ